MNIASITIIILRILLYLFKNLPGPAQGCELVLLRFTAVTSKQVRSESQTRNPHKQIVTHTHTDIYIYIYIGGFRQQVFYLNSMFGPPKPFTSMFFPCPPARFFHAYGRVFPHPRPGFSTPTAGFFHAYGLRPGFSAPAAGFFRGPRPGFSTPRPGCTWSFTRCTITVETPARFAERVVEKLRRFADKFADKLGFDQVSLETTRIDITFHIFSATSPDVSTAFSAPARMFPRCFKARP